MKIAIDCRYLGKSGIGRVCRGILENLDYNENEYYLIGDGDKLKEFGKAVIIYDKTEPFSKTGFLKFNKKPINKICDCIIIPNFIIPLGIKIPVHTVMHDLIFRDLKVTTKGFADRQIKKFLLKRCMKKSKTVACDSEFTKSRCEHYYKKFVKKCYINYPGLSKSLEEFCQAHPEPALKQNKIVYVGNVKPHKGLKILLSAFEKTEGLSLKIIGEKENFLTGLSLDESNYKNVEFTGKISDEELFEEVRTAKYLVLPSQYEGFGLPPLEALCLGTQPIVSDIPVFREVYEGLPVVYFNGEEDLVVKMQQPPIAVDCYNKIVLKYDYKKFVDILLKKIARR